jgi:hypothetical protein
MMFWVVFFSELKVLHLFDILITTFSEKLHPSTLLTFKLGDPQAMDFKELDNYYVTNDTLLNTKCYLICGIEVDLKLIF